MKGTKIAARYATALLELAQEQNKVDAVVGDMNYLLTANGETKDFQILLDSPIIKGDKKIAIFTELFGQFEGVSMSFLKLITEKGREKHIAMMANSFLDQVKELKGIMPVTLVSASPLSDKVKEDILAKVKASVNKELEVTEEINPELVGGFIIRMGDKQIDASVANQLSNLKQRLTR